jgi:hypothetical protein
MCGVPVVAPLGCHPLHIEGDIFQTSDFLLAEAMGTEMKCKKCKFRADSLSFKENQKYRVILDGLKVIGTRGKWTATYPFRIPPPPSRTTTSRCTSTPGAKNEVR